ncbi:hypothetical protein CPC08DRAFT_474494 [Agrocybe pediades]|nr:hypothetical protein CPC08DRAFT_474494 [Agrocybe pediades]
MSDDVDAMAALPCLVVAVGSWCRLLLYCHTLIYVLLLSLAYVDLIIDVGLHMQDPFFHGFLCTYRYIQRSLDIWTLCSQSRTSPSKFKSPST